MWSLALCVAALLCGAYGQTPQVLISPLVIEESQGNNASFFCDIRIPDDAGTINLFIASANSNDFDSLTVADRRLQRADSGSIASFQFGPLTVANNGTKFQCGGIVGQELSEIATISVTFPPNITRFSPLDDPIVVVENTTQTVLLNVSANPQPDYNWTRDGMLLMNGNGLTIALNYVRFAPASRRHSGAYRLDARNSAGADSHMFTFDVQYHPELPVDSDFSNANCTRQGAVLICAAYPGSAVMYNCSADGNPSPNVSISHPGGDNTAVSSDNIITIASAGESNVGQYSCIATSARFPEVNETRISRLYVGGLPVPLNGVTITTRGAVVTATWTYNNSANSVPAMYYVATISQNGTRRGDPILLPISLSNITVPRNLLESGQTYRVSVVVRNLHGDSEAISDSFTFNGAIGVALSYSLSTLLVVCAVFALI